MGFFVVLMVLLFALLVRMAFKARVRQKAGSVFSNSFVKEARVYKNLQNLRVKHNGSSACWNFALDLDKPRYSVSNEFGEGGEVIDLKILEYGYVLNGDVISTHTIGDDIGKPKQAFDDFEAYYEDHQRAWLASHHSWLDSHRAGKTAVIGFYIVTQHGKAPVIFMSSTVTLDANLYGTPSTLEFNRANADDLKWVRELGVYMNYYAYCYSSEMGKSTYIGKSVEVDNMTKHIKLSLVQSEVENIVSEHLSALSKNRKLGCVFDDYGNLDNSVWDKEMEYFINNNINGSSEYTHLAAGGHSISDDFIKILINEAVDGYDEAAGGPFFDEHMSPLEYELYCSEVLSSCGWDTKLTEASGDQGVDIIAERESRKLALQCKLYGSPVGNKAVQEIYSGAKYVGADVAVVVSNATYTKSAKELAGSLGVQLLHHGELNSVV